MNTVAEIEAAIERLPDGEQWRLREWLNRRESFVAPVRPKTGAEVAALLPSRFHLQPAEAEALDLELNSLKKSPPQPSAWE